VFQGRPRRNRNAAIAEAHHWITEKKDKEGFEKRYIDDDIGNY